MHNNYLRIKYQKELVIKDIIGNILKQIDEDIMENYEHKLTTSVTELPEFFELPYTDAVDAQRIIYYRLLKELEKRGLQFNLIIPSNFCKKCKKKVNSKTCPNCKSETETPKKHKTSIVVHLDTLSSKHEKEKMDTYIKSRTVIV